MLWETSSFALDCPVTELTWDIEVALPSRYGTIESPPLIICMDGPWIFGTTRDASRIMSMAREAPEAIVVGVGFQAETSRDYTRLRAQWFSPTPYMPPPETGVRDGAAQDFGRADRTIGFLEATLLPRLADDYKFGERWYIGHSFSGLLGLKALFTKPRLFDKWLLASPSIWWDDGAILADEAGWAAGSYDLHAHVFLSAGEHDSWQTSDGLPIVESMVALGETLQGRNYPSLQLEARVLPGETHFSTIGAAVSAGLRFLSSSR